MTNQEKLDLIAEKVRQCNKCVEFDRSNPAVTGNGSPESKIVFCGEAEGKEELSQGKPFVGKAGNLLTNILAACGVKREDVFITNTCQCRPPNNRTPLPEEAANCRPFLDLQLKVIHPKFIVCLGACAAQNLLNTKTPIGQLRGQWHEYKGIKVMATWHPAYALRNSNAKYEIYKDLMIMVAEMGK